MPKSSPETQIVGNTPISFSFEVLPMIGEALKWPESEHLWDEIRHDGELELRTILTPTKEECGNAAVLLDHVTDLFIRVSNADYAFRNSVFDPHEPWRMYIEMKQRSSNYVREVLVEHKNPRAVRITDTRSWSGLLGENLSDRPGMSVRRYWHRASVMACDTTRSLDLPGVMSAREASHSEQGLSPVNITVWRHEHPDTYVWLDEEKCIPVAWTGDIDHITTRALDYLEQLAWRRANEINWGRIDFSLLNLLSQSQG